MSADVVVIIDLGFGDCGKGAEVDYQCRFHNAGVVVRFNGGAQAGHNVVTPDGKHHCFSQFGAGTFNPGVITYLSKYMLVSPIHLMDEAKELAKLGINDPMSLMYIDRECMIVTPYHEAANCLLELYRDKDRHGSCGYGIGETMRDSLANKALMLKMGHLSDHHNTMLRLEAARTRLRLDLMWVCTALENVPEAQEYIEMLRDTTFSYDVARVFENFSHDVHVVDQCFLKECIEKYDLVVFEGAQGVLLDEWNGFHPHTTWSTTTASNAYLLLNDADNFNTLNTIGVIRAYSTRHGVGPFPTESLYLSETLIDQDNPTNPWQQEFRVGWFDGVLLRYALSRCDNIDALVVSNVDRLYGVTNMQTCNEYSISGDKCNELWLTPPYHLERRNLDRQRMLGEWISSIDPIYEILTNEEFSERHVLKHLEKIQQIAGSVPIVRYSTGPTANDRHNILGDCLYAQP